MTQKYLNVVFLFHSCLGLIVLKYLNLNLYKYYIFLNYLQKLAAVIFLKEGEAGLGEEEGEGEEGEEEEEEGREEEE